MDIDGPLCGTAEQAGWALSSGASRSMIFCGRPCCSPLARRGPQLRNQNPGRYSMTAIAVDELQPRAQAALASSPFYELRELQVEWRDDALQLSGCVSSFYHKQIAQEVVRSVCRDTMVVNSIRVEHEQEDVP
jgi:hypothetical protein